ncbi:phosphoribosylaminoimidazolesuccinocarboxamide synthase [Globicatella sanguinis]|uniref:phosphoribosylaminoimidazolesuccinocarboxamide synthase n=1 Tax=Globicatella sanguinis TaxID=13076 RepID=UPI000C79753C|nr:phosphoribosylaminoimidazolesuccinocarboxamide synthase [Globicatella sanguinis]MDK7631395.1 phosphoribosylaminoimidazolesuccinocarboxamide synthase [Globicatella sanguinis]WIK65938.1 phosphoribosylaminoimidazolesuccinocarboxamide synthase [Globicatella sanguinis]WKT55343.1 phosphoribosylaminoimidazolesuccinocarboxamide synthase [Globicatella sanguinis]
MENIYQGKTKDLLQDERGKTYFHFKDDMTGKDGQFDPGANQVGLTVEGSGKANVTVSKYFFELLEAKGIPTHFVEANIDENTMEIKQATVFGKGLEVICRFVAVGSFIRRYGLYAEAGMPLEGYVEFTLKDDDREDPLINKDALVILGILNEDEYETIKQLTRNISTVIKEDLATKGLSLYDIKLEFGRLAGSDEIVLIDEVSGGNMRVYKGTEYVDPLDIVHYL